MRRLCTVPGVGPVTAGAVIASAPDLRTFSSGRNFAVGLGLVPKQRSMGGKTRLGGVSKVGQTDIRKLLIVGAMSFASRQLIRVGAWLHDRGRSTGRSAAPCRSARPRGPRGDRRGTQSSFEWAVELRPAVGMRLLANAERGPKCALALRRNSLACPSWTPATTGWFPRSIPRLPLGARVFRHPDRGSRPFRRASDRSRTGSSRGHAAFVEDEAVHVVGDVGQRQFRLRACDANGADEQAETVLLMREDMLDGGAER